jgi:hypothetical protein
MQRLLISDATSMLILLSHPILNSIARSLRRLLQRLLQEPPMRDPITAVQLPESLDQPPLNINHETHTGRREDYDPVRKYGPRERCRLYNTVRCIVGKTILISPYRVLLRYTSVDPSPGGSRGCVALHMSSAWDRGGARAVGLCVSEPQGGVCRRRPAGEGGSGMGGKVG